MVKNDNASKAKECVHEETFMLKTLLERATEKTEQRCKERKKLDALEGEMRQWTHLIIRRHLISSPLSQRRNLMFETKDPVPVKSKQAEAVRGVEKRSMERLSIMIKIPSAGAIWPHADGR